MIEDIDCDVVEFQKWMHYLHRNSNLMTLEIVAYQNKNIRVIVDKHFIYFISNSVEI